MSKVIISLIIIFLIFGHTDPVELTKQILGVSIKSLKEEQIGRKSKVFNYDYSSCYEKTLQVLKEMGVYIFRKSKRGHYIVAMNFDKVFEKCIDTTEVGVFFEEINREQTRVDIKCGNLDLVKFIAREVFPRLEKNPKGVGGFVLSWRNTKEKDNLEKLKVIVSIAPFSEWVEGVGKDRVDVTILIPPGTSPHTYEPKPSQLVEVEKAKIFVKNGAGLEFWADKIVEINKDILIVDISQGVELIELSSEKEGRYSSPADPHLWLSLKNAKKGVKKIFEALSKIDPTNKEYYRRNMDKYIQELDLLDKKIGEKLKVLKDRKFIVLHPAWGYFAKDYGLEQIAIQYQGKELSPRDMIRIIEIAKKNNIKVIFAEPEFNPETGKMIAKEIGGEVVFIDPLAENYLENMRLTVDELVKWLK